MAKEARETLLAQSVIPVILGNGITAHLLSVKFFYRYRMTSLLCAARKGLLDYLDPTCDFLRLFRVTEDRLAAERLISLAEEYDETLFVLIPTSEEDRRMVQRYAAGLESRFIVAEPESVFRKPPFVRASQA